MYNEQSQVYCFKPEGSISLQRINKVRIQSPHDPPGDI